MPTLAIKIPGAVFEDGIECCNPKCQYYRHYCDLTRKRLELKFIDGIDSKTQPMQARVARIRPDECRKLEQ